MGCRAAATALLDGLWRGAYRVAFRLQQVYWFVFRPEARGVYVAVWCRGRLLVIQTSYKPEPSIPGGGVRRRESLAAAAARELEEEVGIRVPPETLRPAGELRGPSRYLKDHCHVFEIELPDEPRLAIDRREVVAASFREPAEALSRGLSPIARSYLTELPSGRGRSGLG